MSIALKSPLAMWAVAVHTLSRQSMESMVPATARVARTDVDRLEQEERDALGETAPGRHRLGHGSDAIMSFSAAFATLSRLTGLPSCL